jgi:catechol 2,3-dioxygenase-like lactoylglutathione lyase family enzyme
VGKVLGIGGVFYKVQDPQAVRDWYARVLGFELHEWGGVMFFAQPSALQQWSVFPADSDYLAPSEQVFMLNLMVDDMDGMLQRVADAGVELVGHQDDSYGRFAWLIDPAGVKVELWEPVEATE